MLVIVYIEAPKNGDNQEAGLQKVGYWANFLKMSKFLWSSKAGKRQLLLA